MKSADIFGINQTPTFKMPVKHPVTNKPLVFEVVDAESGKKVKKPLYIEHFSNQSEVGQEWLRNSVNASIDQKEEDRPKRDFDTIFAENNDLLVTLVTGWYFVNLKTGEETPFSKELLAEMLADPDWLWLRTQIDASVKDQSHFFQG